MRHFTAGNPIRRKLPLKLLSICIGLFVWITEPVLALAETSAVVIMYHRFGESEYPSTNTKLEQLDEHIAELTSGAYTVLPVAEIIEKIRQGIALPERTVGITIDDAYRSIYTQAWPKFRDAGLPITVFVATAQVDNGSSKNLTWDQIREMTDSGLVSIGHHSVTHLHMASASQERNINEIENAFQRFEKELGKRPVLLAYPYGEASLDVIKLVRNARLEAAFGQHSGVIGGIGDMFYLPRFAMNEKYGDLARFRMALNARALHVSDSTPSEHLIGERNPPAIGFTLKSKSIDTSGLACFTSHDGKAKLEHLGPARIEVRVSRPFPKGRSRLNCTLRGRDGRWHWLGRQFLRID